MHTLNRISSDDHYYLTPNEQRKAAEVLMRASEQGELDYALGRLIQAGAKRLGKTVSDDQKKQIDAVTKKALPMIGGVISKLTGQPFYGIAASTIADGYESLEPSYDYVKSRLAEAKRKLLSKDDELDFETATKIVKAVDKTLGAIRRNPNAQNAKRLQSVFVKALEERNIQRGVWYKLDNGHVLLKGAGQ